MNNNFIFSTLKIRDKLRLEIKNEKNFRDKSFDKVDVRMTSGIGKLYFLTNLIKVNLSNEIIEIEEIQNKELENKSFINFSKKFIKIKDINLN